MVPFYRYLFVCYLSVSVAMIVRYGYVAATDSTGPRKGRAKFVATLAFAGCFVVLPLLWAAYESQLPTFEFEGAISSVRIENASGSHFSARLFILTSVGRNVTVHVSEASDAWRAGQRLRVKYYGDSGELIRATILDSAGAEVSTVKRNAGFSRVCSALLGLCFGWAAWVQYRRDPDGAVEGVGSSDGNYQDRLLDLEQDIPTSEVIDQIQASARQTIEKQKRWALIASVSFLASCALVWPFLQGNPLHRYWDSTGRYLLMLSMILLLPFAASISWVINAWIYSRDVKRLSD
jgi:hypothetical protein